MQFTYKATNKEGKTISGAAEAANRQALISLLNKQSLHPVLIEAGKGRKSLNSMFGPAKKIKLSQLVIFTRQLSTMISAGVPLARALTALQGDSENSYMREVLAGITKEVESVATYRNQ